MHRAETPDQRLSRSQDATHSSPERSRSRSDARSPSPQVNGKKRRASSVDSLREVKAARHSTSDGRPKAGDYEGGDKAKIARACKGYRCYLSLDGPFPGTDQGLKFTQDSWDESGEFFGIDSELTSRIARIVSSFVRLML